MGVGIRALVGAISREELVLELGWDLWVCLEEAMVGSHIEDVSEQDQGRDLSPPTRGRKDKSCDAISSFDEQIDKLELDMTPKGIWTFWSNALRRPWGICGGRSRTFKRGCKAR